MPIWFDWKQFLLIVTASVVSALLVMYITGQYAKESANDD